MGLRQRLVWLEVRTACRLEVAGRRIARMGRQWADFALRRAGHFSERKDGPQ